MTYGFPFLRLSIRQYTSLKRLIVNPLLRSLGYCGGYEPEHKSIFVESRMLPISSLHTYETLAYLRRLLSLQPNTPYTSILSWDSLVSYLSDVNVLYKPTYHIFYLLRYHMKKMPSVDSPTKLLGINQSDLRQHIFNSYYSEWYSQVDKHSLHIFYPDASPPDIHHLPSYFLHNNFKISQFFSRLRFNRACLNQSLYQRARVPSPCCSFCANNTIENPTCNL